MGTHSLTHIRETENGKDLVCFYQQYDGYPSGLGQELADFLKPFKIVNGFGGNDSACAVCGEPSYRHEKDHDFKPKPVANGIGCLAAQLIAHVKDGLGYVYIYKPNTSDAGDEYQYVIYLTKGKGKDWQWKPGELRLKVIKSGCKAWSNGTETYPEVKPIVLFNGHPSKFDAGKAEEIARKDAT